MTISVKSPLFSRKQAGGAFVFTDETQTTGELFFVCSVTGSDVAGNGKNPDAPLASINFAFTQCVAAKGDRIYAMPGHVETIAAAGTLAANISGVSVIGIGNKFNRPVISYAGTDSVLAVSQPNITFKNILLNAAIDEIVKALSVTAAGLLLDGVDVQEVAAKQFIQKVLTSTAATDLTIQNCIDHQSTASATNALWIQLVGADRFKIVNNRIFITTTNSASSSVIESDTTAPVNGLLKDNIIVQLGGTATVPINMVAGTTGFACGNRVASQKTAIAGSIALASMYGADNYASHVVNKNGLLEPVVDA